MRISRLRLLGRFIMYASNPVLAYLQHLDSTTPTLIVLGGLILKWYAKTRADLDWLWRLTPQAGALPLPSEMGFLYFSKLICL